MVKPNVYVTRIIPDAGLKTIRAATDAEVWEGDEPPPYEILLEKVAGLDSLVCLQTQTIADFAFALLMAAARRIPGRGAPTRYRL